MTAENNKNQLRGSLLLLGTAIIWGFAFVAQSEVARYLGPFGCGFIRFLIAAFALVPVVVFFDKTGKTGRSLFSRDKKPLTRKELLGGIICGTVLSVASATQQAAIGESGAGKAAFITTLYVVLVPLAGAILYRRRPSPILVLSVVLALGGVGLITIREGLSFAPSDLLLFISALCWCTHIMTVDAVSGGCDGVRISLVQMAATSLLNLVLSLIFETTTWNGVAAALPQLLFLGLGSGALAFTLQILGQKECPPAAASIIMSTESLFGVLGGAIFTGEVLTTQEYIGCGVVFLAVLLSQSADAILALRARLADREIRKAEKK